MLEMSGRQRDVVDSSQFFFGFFTQMNFTPTAPRPKTVPRFFFAAKPWRDPASSGCLPPLKFLEHRGTGHD